MQSTQKCPSPHTQSLWHGAWFHTVVGTPSVKITHLQLSLHGSYFTHENCNTVSERMVLTATKATLTLPSKMLFLNINIRRSGIRLYTIKSYSLVKNAQACQPVSAKAFSISTENDTHQPNLCTDEHIGHPEFLKHERYMPAIIPQGVANQWSVRYISLTLQCLLLVQCAPADWSWAGCGNAHRNPPITALCATSVNNTASWQRKLERYGISALRKDSSLKLAFLVVLVCVWCGDNDEF